MTRSKFFISMAALVTLVAMFAAYQAGVRAGSADASAGVSGVLASVQADLGLTKLQRLREIQADLARGCAKVAIAKLEFDVHAQLLVLSSIYNEYKGTWVVESLAKRDPELVGVLESFNQQHKYWVEPTCAS